jgi:proteasome lid subunit RPN8/RPN11
MLTLILPPQITERIQTGLLNAGRREIGGVLMAEHVNHNEFEVREITIHKLGAFAFFVRAIEDAMGQIALFFQKTNRDYVRFNYIGEWHSHPSFEAVPSGKDDESMREIVQDTKVGAHFVVLLVVKLGPEGMLRGSAHTYLPDGSKHYSTVLLAKRCDTSEEILLPG